MDEEHISVKRMWEDYLHSIDESIISTNKIYSAWYFCNNEKSANDLAKLVKKGIKKGTTSLYCCYEIDHEELPRVGDYSIITDWTGIAQCIIRTKKVTILPFKEVTDELAEIEGEGDKSLGYWQKVHMDFFTRELKGLGKEFTLNTLVVFQEFEVVYC